MLEWIIVGLAFAFTVLGPVIRTGGKSAWHNGLIVQLPDPDYYESVGQSVSGVRAQEIGENRFAGLMGVIAAAIAAWLLDGNAAALVVPVAFFAVKAIFIKLPFCDAAGHGAEILVAESEGNLGYRYAEIQRMLRDANWRGETYDSLDAKVTRMEWLSKIMVRLAW